MSRDRPLSFASTRPLTRLVAGMLVTTVWVTGACVEAKAPEPTGRSAMPSCPRGTFLSQIDGILPAMAPTKLVTLMPATNLQKKIEPGCVLPFRNEPDDRVLDVGRVVAKSMRRSAPTEKPVLIGRGRLLVGRGVLRLSLANDAGDPTMDIALDGAHVRVHELGRPAFEADVAFGGTDPLPLPLDALVASLDHCDGDLRLGRTQDGNVIEARRGELPLWRSRWMDAQASSVIDTSVACDPADARLLWRTAAGNLLPMIAVASSRSDRVLVIARQRPAAIDDGDEFGVQH